jgi:hypothetical protein
VILQNLLDGGDYEWALFPGYLTADNVRIDDMLKVRIRDKFVVVDKAKWKIFDQFEIFLDSMTVKLTRKFYRKIQKFMLFTQEKKKLEKSRQMEDEKKIEALIKSKHRGRRDYNNSEEVKTLHNYAMSEDIYSDGNNSVTSDN